MQIHNIFMSTLSLTSWNQSDLSCVDKLIFFIIVFEQTKLELELDFLRRLILKTKTFFRSQWHGARNGRILLPKGFQFIMIGTS